jgi:hypothetical protein
MDNCFWSAARAVTVVAKSVGLGIGGQPIVARVQLCKQVRSVPGQTSVQCEDLTYT